VALRGAREWLDRCQFVCQNLSLNFQVIFGLHVQKPAGVDIEQFAKAQGDAGRNTLTAKADIVDAAASDMKSLAAA